MLEFFYLGYIGVHGVHFALGYIIGVHLGYITIYGMANDVIKRSDWLILVVPIISVVDSPVCNGKQQVQSG